MIIMYKTLRRHNSEPTIQISIAVNSSNVALWALISPMPRQREIAQRSWLCDAVYKTTLYIRENIVPMISESGTGSSGSGTEMIDDKVGYMLGACTQLRLGHSQLSWSCWCVDCLPLHINQTSTSSPCHISLWTSEVYRKFRIGVMCICVGTRESICYTYFPFHRFTLIKATAPRLICPLCSIQSGKVLKSN